VFGSVVLCSGPGGWNASESVPIGLYRLQPTGRLFVTELVAVQPPEPVVNRPGVPTPIGELSY
jgi:type IV secretory pathway protease TraF